MVEVVIADPQPNELMFMESCAHDKILQFCDEKCNYYCFSDAAKTKAYVTAADIISIAVIDITLNGGIELAKLIRERFKEAFLMVIASPLVPPQSYIRPSIMAGALLLRPFDKHTVDEVFEESFKSYFDKFYGSGSVSAFVLKSKEGRLLIDYERINYFESREKRIVLSTDTDEYYFYDTIENLSQLLPDCFYRCHRSFIVNVGRIKTLKLSENLIFLKNDGVVPVSRSFKQGLKERLE